MQGYEQFKWKRRKALRRFDQKINEILSKLELWRKDLKKIEGNFGTGVVAFFLFIKWLIFLNIFIFVLIFLFIVLPMIIFNPPNTTECYECSFTNNCTAIYFNQSAYDNTAVLDFVQGTGWMEHTLFFHGFYSDKVFQYASRALLNYYSLPLAYVSVVAIVLFVSLFAIVRAAARGFRQRIIEGEGQFYQYCNLIFGGWDFCIHNEKAATMKKKVIYNEIKGCLEAEKLEEEKKRRSKQERTKLIALRIFINLVEIVILVGCGAAIYFIFTFSSRKRDEVGEDQASLILFYGFLPSMTIVFLNVIVPLIFKFLVTYERYSPNFVINIMLIRTVFLRLAALIIFYASMYTIISCQPEEGECSSKACNTPLCWETFVGQHIYKLAITDFATHILLTFVVNFPRALLDKKSKSKFANFIGEQMFDLPKHVLDIIYTQTLCWLGCFYAPMLPAMFVVIFIFMFYIKKFACLVNSKPSNVIHRASRSNSMFMIILLVSFIVALLPVAYTIGEIRPSISCGPFRNRDTIWSFVGNSFLSTPDWFQNLLDILTSTFFTIPAFIVLVLCLYYYTAVNSANKHMVRILKDQLVLEGHDKQFLLERLSLFIKQQQDAQKHLRRAEGDRNAASN